MRVLASGAVELRNSVSAAFGMELSPTATFDYPTVTALAAYIAAIAPPAPAGVGFDAAGHEVEVHSAAPSASAILAQLQARCGTHTHLRAPADCAKS